MYVQSLTQGAVLTPLMSGFDMNNAGGAGGVPPVAVNSGNGVMVPSDPVELRRINFQTPGMISHPPIPVNELALHTDDLKANDNMKFSQEYESIEPGQQFTWDNSSMEVHFPSNIFHHSPRYGPISMGMYFR